LKCTNIRPDYYSLRYNFSKNCNTFLSLFCTALQTSSFLYTRHHHRRSSANRHKSRHSIEGGRSDVINDRSVSQKFAGRSCCRRWFQCSEKQRFISKTRQATEPAAEKTGLRFGSSMPIGRDVTGGDYRRDFTGGDYRRDVTAGGDCITYAEDSFSNSVSTIDKLARVLFPAFFIAFNIFYWTWYS